MTSKYKNLQNKPADLFRIITFNSYHQDSLSFLKLFILLKNKLIYCLNSSRM